MARIYKCTKHKRISPVVLYDLHNTLKSHVILREPNSIPSYKDSHQLDHALVHDVECLVRWVGTLSDQKRPI